ncbi:MAG TPA: hypothetical protein VGO59_20605 [Verrucomicrobiae bacterium]|jgi:hypothetical protein
MNRAFSFLLIALAAVSSKGAPVRIQVETDSVVSRISPRFIGFGYETSAVAQPGFFSARNAVMIQLYRNLSPHGLIRIGGIISDHTEYAPNGALAARTQTGVTVINKASLEDLGQFARAIGWQVMWGLNLGTGSKEMAVEEAQAVDAALGNGLQSFQIGNEVEALRRFAGSYEDYHSNYAACKAAIRSVLPGAPFSGPDVIGNLRWISNFVSAESKDMKLLTHHYYRGGAGNPKSTLDLLLQHDAGFDRRLGKLREICQEPDLSFRINEVNSYSGGGKAGVSDTFGSALWCLDYMFALASYGCDGVNMETDINQLGFISYYSPIVHDASGHCNVRPEYYGMLAFAVAGKGEMLKIDMEKPGLNLSAYAARSVRGELWVAVINKDFARDADVEVTLPKGYSTAAAMRLAAPSMISTNQVTLGGAGVSAAGIWTPGPLEKAAVTGNTARISIPRASAALLQLR